MCTTAQKVKAQRVILSRTEQAKLVRLEDVIETANRVAIEQAKPLLKDGTILCGDCINAVGTLADSSVSLFLFSPPYCDQRQGHYPGVCETDYPDWMARVMAALKPKLSQRGSVLIVAREHLRDGQ